ncbi:TetR/AcrR family transcriptional regulator [Pyruvatibacter sp.]|uniref:TetR/AcrR family transcriptional regulator n=1 Tax=Pyruvatibacter sp. TaxID=1981328 RepID=UPI0032ECE5BD
MAGNREKIIEGARQLMNREGTSASGTTRIADALGISPGNLYYHFKSREEIVAQIYARFERAFRDSLVSGIEQGITPVRFAAFYINAMQFAWEYRFFFASQTDLLSADENLAVRHHDLQTWSLAALENIVVVLEKQGTAALPKGRGEAARLRKSIALNTWLLWSTWISFLKVEKPESQLVRGDMARGAMQMFDVFGPWLDAAFEKAAREALTKELDRAEAVA